MRNMKGNRARGKLATDALRKAAADGKALGPIAKKLIEMAKKGDLGAIKEFYDRLDGKALQTTETTKTVKHVTVTPEELAEFDRLFNQEFMSEVH